MQLHAPVTFEVGLSNDAIELSVWRRGCADWVVILQFNKDKIKKPGSAGHVFLNPVTRVGNPGARSCPRSVV